MDYKIIQQVIGLEDLSSDQKLEMISKIAHKFEELEEMTAEKAINEGRYPTTEDEYQMAEVITNEICSTKTISTERLEEMLYMGIRLILSQQTKNGGWGRKQFRRIPARLHERIKRKKIQHPIPSAWVTVMALNALQNYKRFYLLKNKPDQSLLTDVEKSILKGIQWIIDNQNDDGSWNDLDRRLIDSEANIIQTCMAICMLISYTIRGGSENCIKSINSGLIFLAENRDPSSGGWASLPKLPAAIPDSKATSMAVFASLLADKYLKMPTPIAGEMTRQAVDWLLKNQLPEGNWGYKISPDSFLYGVYYCIEALEYYRLLNNNLLSKNQQHSYDVQRALRRALRWYTKSNRLIRYKNKIGWAWKNGDRSGDIANTAFAIAVLLDCAEEDFSFVIQRGVEFLVEEANENELWNGDTAIVVHGFMKYLNPSYRTYIELPSTLYKLKRGQNAT